MTWENAIEAIRVAVANAAGLPVGAVEWSDTGRDGDWIGYPRIKLVPSGNRTIGIPQVEHTWVPGKPGTPEVPAVPAVPGSGPLPATNLIHRYNWTAVNGTNNVGVNPGPLSEWVDMVGGVNLFSSGGSRPDFSNDGVNFYSTNPVDGKFMVGGGLFDSGADKTWVLIVRPTIPRTAQHYFVVAGVNASGGQLTLGTYNSNRITWLGGGFYELESAAPMIQNEWFVIVARVSAGQVRLRVAGSAGDNPEAILPYARVGGWITNLQLGSSTMAMRVYELALYDAVLSDNTVDAIVDYAANFVATGNIGGSPGTPEVPAVPAVPATPGYMRREVWSNDTIQVVIRIESERTSQGLGALFSPADRVTKVLRTPEVSEALEAASVAFQKIDAFGPFAVTAENRELSVSVAMALFQVNVPVDTTPPAPGVGYFTRVQLRREAPEGPSTRVIGPVPGAEGE